MNKELTPIERAAEALWGEQQLAKPYLNPEAIAAIIKRELGKAVPEKDVSELTCGGLYHQRISWNACRKAIGLD